ncbi:hypothetical protein Clacol_000311 [Clathrus columnatus]|uniref:ATP synthase subunit 5, mitochondrial n=1 Tax=Clathrus columnatus TaxID=1419009 RepID=A0AAV4ZWH0_9AGAM|nr:hypothetical protein Clacol_000311 [Clathrus columnatus]
MLVNAARTATTKSSSIFCRRAASSVALKYSNALYSAALSKSPQTLTKVQSELAVISNGIKTQKDLAAFISNPTLSIKDRAEGLKAVFAVAEGSGKKEPLTEITKNFFAVLSENGRLTETQGAIDGFNELVSKYKGEVEVVVTSATPLDRPTLTRLESTLKQSQIGQKAKTLKVTNKVNPSILGGLIVDFGEKTIDLSVSSRVNKFNTLLQEGV